MKKSSFLIVGILIFLGIFGVSGFYIFSTKIGDVRPALLPAQDIPSVQTTSPNTSSTEKFQASTIPLELPEGFAFTVYAENLGKARDVEIINDVVVVSIPEKGQVMVLKDTNADGKAEIANILLTNLNKPHGLAFHKGKLFVAEETQVVRYSFDGEKLTATQEKKLFDLPAGGRHTTRTLAFDDKDTMYISIGSTCDVCYEKDKRISTIMISDADGNNPRVFAKGLRNAPFIAWNSQTNSLWVTEMGRDFLGDNIPPDEINIVTEGKDYGWPICYGNNIHDTKFDKNTYIQDPCKDTQKPVYNIPAHSAPLGITFINSSQFPENWQGDALVAYHGSWNSTKPVGYKIVRLKVNGNTVEGEENFMTGFLPSTATSGGQTIGRPVDMAFSQEGNLFVSDDKSGRIYMIYKQ